jgi:3-phosphoinositide dependent protein kinase-1
LYSFLVGSAPFRGESDYATFQKIQNAEYTAPDFLPSDAKDLLSKLLVIDPTQRLGHGAYDDNYAPIRNHPFFSSISDWEGLPSLAPPAWAPFPPAAAAKAARGSAALPQPGRETSGFVSERQSSASERESEAGGRESLPVEECKYPSLLLPGERCVAQGLIVKKRFMSVKKRWLVLTSTPRLFYINEENNQIMGTIPLSAETNINVQGADKWVITVSGKNWPLQQVDGPPPKKWKEFIATLLADRN